MTEITIPDSVTSIGDYAFYGCSNLTEITIPESVTSIGGGVFLGTAFYNDKTNWEDGVLYIENHLIKAETTISGAYTIKSGTLSIASYAFDGCSSLTSITIPDSVPSIGSVAFRDCSSLTEVTIPDSVTSIGSYAFYDCSSLSSVTIGEGVTSIGSQAFRNCSGLTEVTIGEGVTSIGSSAFSNCSSLTKINYNAAAVADLTWSSNVFYNAGSNSEGITVTFGESVTSIPAYLFYISSSSYAPNLVSVTIGSNVDSIGSSAFRGCSSLTSITIPEGVTSIEDYAFYNCSSLTSITIPDSVTSIGSYAFTRCSSLASVTLGSNVKSIGKYAFSNCSSLTSVTFENTEGWWCSTDSAATSGTAIASSRLADPSTAVVCLRSTYPGCYWRRS